MTDPTPDREVRITVEDGDLPAQLFLPPGGSGPGVLLLQEIFGVTDYIRSRARDLAHLGYVVLVPQTYWRQGSLVIDEGEGGLEEAMGTANSLDWERTVADTVAAARALRELPETTGRTGVMGFCFGGGLAWATTARLSDEGDPPAALLAYYGSQIPTLLDLADHIDCPQLHHWGSADQFIPAEGVDAVEQAVTSATGGTFCRHDGAGHAFDNPSPTFHHPQASARAWETTTKWLGERLGAAVAR